MRTQALDRLDFPWSSFGEFLESRMQEYGVDENLIHQEVRMTRSVLHALRVDRYDLLPTTIESQLGQLAPYLRLSRQRLLALYSYYRYRHDDELHRERRQESMGDIGSVMWIWIGGLGGLALVLFLLLSFLPTGSGESTAELARLPTEALVGPETRLVSQLFNQLEEGWTTRPEPTMLIRVTVPEETWIRVVVDEYSEHRELLATGDTRQWSARELVRIECGIPERIQIFRDGLLLNGRPDGNGCFEIRPQRRG